MCVGLDLPGEGRPVVLNKSNPEEKEDGLSRSPKAAEPPALSLWPINPVAFLGLSAPSTTSHPLGGFTDSTPIWVCTSAPGSWQGSQNSSPILADLSVFFRARPVVQINASLHFEPPKINIFHKDCKRNGRDATCLAAFLCFVPVFLAPHFQTATVGKPASLGH